MPSGSPETSTLTTPQKHSPLCVAIALTSLISPAKAMANLPVLLARTAARQMIATMRGRAHEPKSPETRKVVRSPSVTRNTLNVPTFRARATNWLMQFSKMRLRTDDVHRTGVSKSPRPGPNSISIQARPGYNSIAKSVGPLRHYRLREPLLRCRQFAQWPLCIGPFGTATFDPDTSSPALFRPLDLGEHERNRPKAAVRLDNNRESFR